MERQGETRGYATLRKVKRVYKLLARGWHTHTADVLPAASASVVRALEATTWWGRSANAGSAGGWRATALLSLVEAGLASAFQYNEVTQIYEQIDCSQAAPLAEPSFFARR